MGDRTEQEIKRDTKTHSLLSPSSAERWLNCPPSARMCEKFPEETSEYAEEGTTAHALGEIKLLRAFEKISEDKYQKRLQELKQDKFYSEEMEETTDYYLSVVKSLQTEEPKIFEVERSLDLTEFIPDGHGTADCLFLENTTLNIVDYKHGQGVLVEAPYNEQLQLYALGAYQIYSVLFDIKEVQMTICQPRKSNVDSFKMKVENLLNFGEHVKKVAPIAWKGMGYCNAGRWCKFCRALPVCEAQAERARIIKDKINNDINCLSDVELVEVLDFSDSIINFLQNAKNYAMNRIIDGKELTGYKVVEGRSRRIFSDENKAIQIASELIPSEELYEKKLISLANIEKKVGKKVFAEKFKSVIYTPQGSPTLVKDEDKRPEFKKNPTPQEDFKDF